MFQVEGLLLNR